MAFSRFKWAAPLALAFCLAGTGYAQAKKEKVFVDQASKPRGNGMEGIKRQEGVNDPAKTPKAPANKGGEKSRGVIAAIKVDNWTGLYIQIYIDDEYEGTVSPYGELYTLVRNGRTKFYGVARFTDGSVRTWGPRVEVIDDVYTWKLVN